LEKFIGGRNLKTAYNIVLMPAAAAAPAAPAAAPAEAPAAAPAEAPAEAPAATGECKPGDRHCIGETVAEVLTAPSKSVEIVTNMGINLVEKAMTKLKDVLTDQTKCVQTVVNDLPSLAGKIITSLGNSTSGALDKITNSVKSLFDEVGNREIKGYPNIFGPFETVYALIIINIQNIINKIALGENANQILADPNMDSTKLFAKMMKTSERYSDAVKEAQFQGVFKKWITNYVSALLNTLDIAQPEIDRVNKKLKDIIQGVGSNIGKSITHALVNIIKAIVSNIPVVGGIVSVLTSADEMGQEIIKTCTPPLVTGAGTAAEFINGVNAQLDKTKCAFDSLGRMIGPILNVKGPQAGGGGGNRREKNTHKKILNTTKRIRVMLSRLGGTQRRRRHGGGGVRTAY